MHEVFDACQCEHVSHFPEEFPGWPTVHPYLQAQPDEGCTMDYLGPVCRDCLSHPKSRPPLPLPHTLATHTDDFLPCTAVALGVECARSHKYPDPGFPYRLRIDTQTYGELVSQPDIWEHESAGTMVGGYWGPYRIFASVPLYAVYVYPVRMEN